MSCDLTRTTAPETLYRIARKPDPWRLPDWAFATDGTFGNRYDDPQSEYRVLYAGSQRLGTFLETLARFRHDPEIAAAEIEPDARDERYPTLAPGTVPADWLHGRAIGTARLDGDFASVGAARSLAYLRRAMAERLAEHGLADLDAAMLRLSVPRSFTQALSRLVYVCATDSGERQFDGICYGSRLGDDLVNWALFEPVHFAAHSSQPLFAADPDFRRALELFGLRFAGDPVADSVAQPASAPEVLPRP